CWRATAFRRISSPISTATKVRTRDMRESSKFQVPSSRLDGVAQVPVLELGTWNLELLLSDGLVPELPGPVVEAGPDLGDDLHRQEVRGPGGAVGRDAVGDAVEERPGEHVPGPGQVLRLAPERRDVVLGPGEPDE